MSIFYFIFISQSNGTTVKENLYIFDMNDSIVVVYFIID